MRRHSTRRLPMEGIKAAVQDGRVWVKIGVVRLFDGETSHYELDGEDIVVDVELMPERHHALCRLGNGHGGVVRVPAVGTEVLVAVPEGDMDCDPVIVAELSSGAVPDGVSESVAVIRVPAGGKLKIHAGSAGDAQPLATKADVETLRGELNTFRTAVFNVHTHVSANNTAPAGATAAPLPLASVAFSAPVGTQVTESE